MVFVGWIVGFVGCGFSGLWWKLWIVKVVACGGGCGLWRFWVVVEVVACFVGFVLMGVG